MAQQFPCDYCRATIDTSSDDALIVTVSRRVDDDEWEDDVFISGVDHTFRFCKQEHLSAYMENTPLPPLTGEADDDGEDIGVVGCLVMAVVGAVLLALLVGAAYGLYQLVTDLL